MLQTRKVSFFIVGAPKCATSALSEYLKHHPSLYLPNHIESSFFCTDMPKVRRINSVDSYNKVFLSSSSDKISGEKSVLYMYSNVAVRNIMEYNKRSKIIAILRNPINLALSLHTHYRLLMLEDIDDFESAWRAQGDRSQGKRIPYLCAEPRILQYGKICSFYEQIKRIVEEVPSEQRLFLRHEDFVSSPRERYEEILRFIGVESDGRTEFPIHNVAAVATHRMLQRLIRNPPGAIKMVRNAIRRFVPGFSFGMAKFAIPMTKPAPTGLPILLSPAFKAELEAFFAEDVRKTDDLLKAAASGWKTTATA